ncbi:MAG: MBL fold metallo-hydrolase [Acidobacteria bacterium RIFCSPLOWO2_02_FULL_61_28]|nr:MAG: MBL fold metallo-hydrolase [Acidobacteria bacterium RIFCSPLOWO2_02_FULL_61_28]
MYFEQFYLACLSHASYMIGSEGVAAVIDPQRDVAIYLEEARKNGLQIAHVIETHLHADFISGHRELAAATGARIYLGAKAGAKFPHVPVRDGDEIRFGRCRLEFLETPGHTVESLCIVVTDFDRSPEPFAVFTGDTLFIGDVGRPDLSGELTPQELAGMLYDSLHDKLLKLPDAVEVYPAHGAGSLCGRQMSSERSSTIGKERAANYAVRAATREEFVRLLTSELPERPGYFALDAEINRAGAPPLSELRPLPALSPVEVLAKQKEGILILDTRPADQFAAAHIPGSIFIGLSGQYASWAGTLLGLDSDLILVAEDPERVTESRVRLARVGIERVVGYLGDGIAGWTRAGFPAVQTPYVSAEELHRLLRDDGRDIQLLDVRRPPEWEEGHIEQATSKPLHKLTALLADLDPQRLTVVHCQSGYRSLIASSLLQRSGFQQVINVTGGFDAWRACSLPFVQPRPAGKP